MLSQTKPWASNCTGQLKVIQVGSCTQNSFLSGSRADTEFLRTGPTNGWCGIGKYVGTTAKQPHVFLVHLKQLYFLGLWVLRTSYLKGMSREVGIGEGPKIETSETKKVALSHIVHYWVVLWQLCKLCITHNLCYSVSFVVWAAFDCNGHHIDWLSEKRTQRKGAPVRVITSYYYSMLCTFGYSATSSSVPWRQKSELCHSH